MVLAQVRISPVLKMKDYVPALQEQFRHKGFPGFRSEQVHEIQLGTEPRVDQRERWLFVDKENREAVVLSQDFVVLETSHYACFEDFTERLKSVLDVLGATIDATTLLAQRLGLRYVDLIVPAQGETLDEYLQPTLLGLRAGDLEIEKVLNRFEARGRTRTGQLMVRLHQNDIGAPLPPDLLPAEIDLGERPLKGDEVITLLDIDHFSTSSRDYEPNALIDGLWQLHDYTEKAFLSSVTPLALERWDKE
jgi:uncharacterized protein (TIGR04255 family)